MKSRWVKLALLLLAVGVAAYFLYPRTPAAAIVNGYRIPMSVVDGEMAMLAKAEPKRFSGTEGQKERDRVRRELVNELVVIKLVGQAAYKSGITVSGAEIDAEQKRIEKIFKGRDKLLQALRAKGWTERLIRGKLKDQLAGVKLQQQLRSEVKPTPEQIERYYKENKASLSGPAKEARAKARKALIADKERASFDAWLKKVRAEAKIVIY